MREARLISLKIHLLTFSKKLSSLQTIPHRVETRLDSVSKTERAQTVSLPARYTDSPVDSQEQCHRRAIVPQVDASCCCQGVMADRFLSCHGIRSVRGFFRLHWCPRRYL
jgi:hypothetical protein